MRTVELPSGTVTFLFSDIEGSTRLLHHFGDRWPAILGEHSRIVREAIAQGGGHEVSTEGDSFFAAYASPSGAVTTALAMQRMLAAHPWPDGAEVRVRIGLHTGEGELAGHDYVGLDVHRAARIAAAGHGGQVLLSSPTAALAEGTLPEGLHARDLGPHRLKDLGRPERLFQLCGPDLESEFPPLRSLDARPNNLPLQLTSFLGREREIAEAEELLDRARLVTLTGPGGTGKTRLSLEVASDLLDRFGDGVFFVALAPIADPALIATTIAGALRVPEQVGQPIADTLKDHLREREMLLVLDNFEQILAGAGLVAELLAAAPRLKALVSSRAALHVSGEQEYPVPPLRLPDPRHLPSLDVLSQYEAVALFVERAAAVRPGFEVTNETAPAVAEICARVDGLPLAIELAAARIRTLGPQAILERLESRLSLLSGGARDLPARQQTLRGTIAWSYDLLDEGERALFRRLAVFVGGFGIEAAEAVCTPAGELGIDAVDVLESLVDKSLARTRDSASGEPRFRLLQTIREFGLEALSQAPDEEREVRARHAQLFLELAEEAEPKLMGPEHTAWLERLAEEHDNLRAALSWAIETDRAEVGLRLGGALWRFWHLRAHLAEGERWLTELLALPSAAAATPARAKGIDALASLVYWQADYERARGHYEAALAIYRELGDRHGEAAVLYSLSYLAGAARDWPAGIAHSERARDIFEELGDRHGVGRALGILGFALHRAGDDARALPHIQASLAIYRELDDRFWIAAGWFSLGRVQIDAGDHGAGRGSVLESLRLYADLGDISGAAYALDALSEVALARRQPARAVRLAAAAAAFRGTLGGRAPTGIVGDWDVRAAVRGGLPAEEIEAAWREGRDAGLDQIVAYAHEEEPARVRP